MVDDAAYDGVSDQDLLTRHVDGDPDAFGEIVRRHRDRLWAVALRTLGTARRPLTPSRTPSSPPTGPPTPSAASRPSRHGCTASP